MLAFCEFSFGPDILLLLQIPQVEGPAVAVGHHGNHQGEGEEREAADRDVAEPRREVARGRDVAEKKAVARSCWLKRGHLSGRMQRPPELVPIPGCCLDAA